MTRIASISILFFTTTAFAGQFSESCKKEGQSAQRLCDQAVSQAANNEAGFAASQMASNTKAGDRINKDAGNSSSSIAAQQQNIANTQANCQKALNYCQSKCDQAASQAKAAAASQPPSSRPPYDQDAAQVPKEKTSQCEAPLKEKMGKLAANKAPLGDQKKEAEQTGQQSGQNPAGQPPQGGGSGGGDSASPSSVPSDISGLNTQSTGALDSSQSLGEGTAGFQSPATPASSVNSGTQAVTEGSGANSATQSGTVSSSASSGGASAGGGGTGGGAMATLGTAKLDSPTKNNGNGSAASSIAASSAGSTGGGGGGFSGYGNGTNDQDSGSNFGGPLPFGEKEKPLLPAAPVAGSGVSDVSQPHGPSIFFMSDAAYASYCRKNDLKKHCAK